DGVPAVRTRRLVEEVARRVRRRNDAEVGGVVPCAPASADVYAVAHRLTIRATDGDADRPREADIHVASPVAEHVRQDDDLRPAANGFGSIAGETRPGRIGEVYGAVAHPIDLTRDRLRGEGRWGEREQHEGTTIRHGAHRLMRSSRNF